MNADVYYFSGTGNSLAVARKLAEKLNGDLHALPILMDQERITAYIRAGKSGDFEITSDFLTRLADMVRAK